MSCSDYVSDNKPVTIQTEGTSDIDLGLMEWLGVPLVLGYVTTLTRLICCLDTAVQKCSVYAYNWPRTIMYSCLPSTTSSAFSDGNSIKGSNRKAVQCMYVLLLLREAFTAS